MCVACRWRASVTCSRSSTPRSTTRWRPSGAPSAPFRPYVDGGQDDYPRAREAIAELGLTYDADFTAVAQLDEALRALDAAGLDASPAALARYGAAMRQVAADEIAPMGGMSRSEAVTYAVLGTAMYEPVMLALRRLAHHHLLVERTAHDPVH